MGISISFTDNFRSAEKTIDKANRKTLNIIGFFLVSQSKLRCPVDTGYLRGSIKHIVKGLPFFKKTLSIFSEVPYAIFVHEGTRKMRARRFIRDAIMENMNQIKSIANQEYRRFF